MSTEPTCEAGLVSACERTPAEKCDCGCDLFLCKRHKNIQRHHHIKANPKADLWENNELQFARLICEIVANHETLNFRDLEESMDLDEPELQELFERAHIAWEKAKGNL